MDAGLDAGVDAGSTLVVQWTACALYTGGQDSDAECADVQVPLRWEEPQGRHISVRMKRLRVPNARGSVWLLQGGPGGSGTVFEGVVTSFASRGDNVDIYMPEHRGVGASTRLSCPVQESPDSGMGFVLDDNEVAGCVAAMEQQWGEDAKAFTTTQAAMDLGRLIEATRRPADKVFVYGVSYGTYWAHRYLHLFPDQANGVVLDSICSPGQCQLPMDFTRNHDRIGGLLLEACGNDPLCSSKLGTGMAPVTLARDVMTRYRAGTHCPDVRAIFPPLRMSNLLGSLTQSNVNRGLVPPVLYRLNRCSAEDVQAFRVLDNTIGRPPMPNEADRQGSTLLYAVVARAELWDEPAPTVAEYTAFLDTMTITVSPSPEAYGAFLAYNSYARDGYWGQFATTSVPLLMLNGTMDPQTSLLESNPTGQHFTGPHQTYVVVDRAPHAVLFSSRYEEDPFLTCGWDLFEQFVRDPTATLDVSCATMVEPFRFTFDPAVARSIFNTNDLYEAMPGPPPAPVSRQQLDAIRERLRRDVHRTFPW